MEMFCSWSITFEACGGLLKVFYPSAKRGVLSSCCRLSTFPCEQHNSTKSYPILMKLHRIVPWWVRKNPIDFCYDDVISDVTVTSFPVKSALELVSTITWPFFIQSSPNLVGLMLYEQRRTLLNDVVMTSSVTSQLAGIG